MPVIDVESPFDPRLREYRSVGDPELAVRTGLFVAEGRLVVSRLIETGRFALRSVLLSPAAFEALAGPLTRLHEAVPVYVLSGRAFEAVTGVRIHRGCLALAERPPAPAPRALVPAARLVVVLEAVGNPDNVGGIFRNAAAFGADAVLLGPGCCDPLYRKTIRTSMGAALTVPFAVCESWPGELANLRANGFTLVALTPDASATPLDEFAARARDRRLALLCGTEGEGLTGRATALADVRVRIPTTDCVDSLNVAVALGIVLSHVARL